MKRELVGRHRRADRKGEDLFHMSHMHVLSHLIPFCVNWSPALTKPFYRKDDLRNRIGVRH